MIRKEHVLSDRFSSMLEGKRRQVMRQKMKMDGIHLQETQPRGSQLTGIPMLMPRIWKVLIALALPFTVFCADYCESLERTSVLGAYIADILLPMAIIGYIVLVLTLRNRDV